MAECNITSVQVLNNPAQFTDPIVLEVQYECVSSLQDDLEWRVVYVGSAQDDTCDQVLDSALVGPVQPGLFKFRMEAPAPDPNRIPVSDLLGVTALLLTCSYKEKEFVRVGYYVNVEYSDPELAQQDPPPNPPRIDRLQRNIMADHPRVTRFPHSFDNPEPEQAPRAEPEPEPDDLLLEDDDQQEEEEDEDDEGSEYGEEEEGTMVEEEINLELENLDPSAAGVQGKAGPAAAAAAAAAGVDDMEL